MVKKIKRLRKLGAPAQGVLDPRVRRSREHVLQATLALLVQHGFGGVSVDEVCRRSGVAKTTVYRHWPTRSELLIDACKLLNTPQTLPDTGGFAGDVAALVKELAGMLRSAQWPSILPSVIDAAERDPAIAEVYRGIQQGHDAPYLAVIERAKHRGELKPHVEASEVIAALVGPLFFRRWFSRERLDSKFAQSVASSVVAAFT